MTLEKQKQALEAFVLEWGHLYYVHPIRFDCSERCAKIIWLAACKWMEARGRAGGQEISGVTQEMMEAGVLGWCETETGSLNARAHNCYKKMRAASPQTG